MRRTTREQRRYLLKWIRRQIRGVAMERRRTEVNNRSGWAAVSSFNAGYAYGAIAAAHRVEAISYDEVKRLNRWVGRASTASIKRLPPSLRNIPQYEQSAFEAA